MCWLLIWPVVSLGLVLILPGRLEPETALTIIFLWPGFIPRLLWRVTKGAALEFTRLWKAI